jgi:hypothetical protein
MTLNLLAGDFKFYTPRLYTLDQKKGKIMKMRENSCE